MALVRLSEPDVLSVLKRAWCRTPPADDGFPDSSSTACESAIVLMP